MQTFSNWLEHRDPDRIINKILDEAVAQEISFSQFWQECFLPQLKNYRGSSERQFLNELFNWFKGKQNQSAPPMNNDNAANMAYASRMMNNVGKQPGNVPYSNQLDAKFQSQVEKAKREMLMPLRQQFAQHLKQFVTDVEQQNMRNPTSFSPHAIELAKRVMKNVLPVADKALSPTFKKAAPGMTPQYVQDFRNTIQQQQQPQGNVDLKQPPSQPPQRDYSTSTFYA